MKTRIGIFIFIAQRSSKGARRLNPGKKEILPIIRCETIETLSLAS